MNYEQAYERKKYIEARQRPYWYDKLYGTNHYGLNGHIPSIFEIEAWDATPETRPSNKK